MLIRAAIAFLLAVLLLGGYDAVRPVLATHLDPDSTDIVSARGFGDVAETGDILLIIHYDVDFTTVPSIAADRLIIGRYLDGSVPEKARSPFAFVNSGFGQGAIFIYFDAAEATTAGIAHGDADQAQIQGNPAEYTNPWGVTKAISWATLNSQTELEDHIRDIAQSFETQAEWAGEALTIPDTSGVLKLDTDGEQYFITSFPLLREVASDLFLVVFEAAQFVTSTHPQTYRGELEDFWLGTVFEDDFDDFATWTGFGVMGIKTAFSTLLALGIAGTTLVGLRRQDVDDYVASGCALMAAAVIVGVAARLGFFDISFQAIIAAVGMLLLGFIFFLRRSG